MEPVAPDGELIPEDIAELARVVYEGEVERFLDTPRQSLGSRTPREALADGDSDAVRSVLATHYEGTWA